MTKRSVVKLPNGTVIEISPDLSPEQITAMIMALNGSPVLPVEKKETARVIEEREVDDIWNSSKREQVALFIRSYFAEDLWFNARDVLEQQIVIVGKLPLGDTSALGTYLTRLYESKHLDRKKVGGRSIYYRMTEKLCTEYPIIQSQDLQFLMESKIGN